jgi:hypothetical protein
MIVTVLAPPFGEKRWKERRIEIEVRNRTGESIYHLNVDCKICSHEPSSWYVTVLEKKGGRRKKKGCG